MSDEFVPMHAEREQRSHRRLTEAMSDSADLAEEMAQAGLISPEAAKEHRDLADSASKKYGTGEATKPAANFAKDQLKSLVERIERLEEEKKQISDDIRDVYAEAKGNGFDVKALRQIIKLRKQDPNERAEAETILETYMQALGML